MRTLITRRTPDVVEEVKWVKATSPGTPTWSHDGIICTGESYKSVVKLTFAKGASLPDPATLFNASLEGNTRRAIDIHEGEQIDPARSRRWCAPRIASTSPARSRARSARSSASLRRCVAGRPHSIYGAADGDRGLSYR